MALANISALNRRRQKQKDRERFYDTIAEQFDTIMNRYDLEKRLRLVFERGFGSETLAGKLVLDAGCGTGEFSRRAAAAGARVVALDIGPRLVRVAKRKTPELQGVVGTLMALPFPDNAFDDLICSEAIEHTVSPRLAVLELCRVLKPGGKLVLTVPNRRWYFALLIARWFNLRPYHGNEHWVTRKQLHRWLSDGRCRVESAWGFHLIPFIFPVTYRFIDYCDRFGTRLGTLMVNLGVVACKDEGRDVDRRVPPSDCAEPIRVLRVMTRMNIGGPSIHAALLSSRLDPERFSTCLVVGEPEACEGDLAERIHGCQVRMIRMKTLCRPIRPWADALSFFGLLGIVWKERPHIIHTHMAKAGALGRLAGWWYNTIGPGRRPGARASVIHTFHGHVLEGYFALWLSRLFVIIERWLAHGTDRLIAVSPSIRDELLKKGIGRHAQWVVIPLGLELAPLAQLSFPTPAASVRVGLVGRLVPIKNPSLFLEALAHVAVQPLGGAVSGLVVGDGPLRASLERQAVRLGLNGRVRFTGWQRDLRAVYEQLDVVCVTSWNEGTPVSLIEAMAAGRAVVATAVGGVRDLVDGEASQLPKTIPAGGFQMAAWGVLVNPGDAEGLAAALKALASDAGLRYRLGHTTRSYVLQRFSAQRLLDDIATLYERLHMEPVPCMP